tara:strand:- start:36919 stop:37401 length:483 start_codon:yes stop_codon:yes gene_type:complete
MSEPTNIQHRYIAYIDHYIRCFDNFPSVAVLAKAFGVTQGASYQNCMLLERKGFLKKVPGRKCYQRTIKFKQYMASWPKGEAHRKNNSLTNKLYPSVMVKESTDLTINKSDCGRCYTVIFKDSKGAVSGNESDLATDRNAICRCAEDAKINCDDSGPETR